MELVTVAGALVASGAWFGVSVPVKILSRHVRSLRDGEGLARPARSFQD